MNHRCGYAQRPWAMGRYHAGPARQLGGDNAWHADHAQPQDTTSSRLISEMTMNQYGQRLMTHWQTYRPTEYATIEDPKAYFSEMGEEIAARIDQLASQIEAQNEKSTPTPSYLTRVGQMNMARMTAESTVMADFLPRTQEDEEDQDLVIRKVARADGMPIDPMHPLWAAQDDENVSPEEFGRMFREWLETVPENEL